MHAALVSTTTGAVTRHASRRTFLQVAARHRSSTQMVLKRSVNARCPTARKLPSSSGCYHHHRPTTSKLSSSGSKNQNHSTLALESLRSLQRSSEQNTLSWEQIRTILISSAVPMVGFGFMDNFVMIQAGSYIDNTIGVKFGLATMTAAAMGQVVSDVSGVLFGGTLERILSPWVKPAHLTTAQKSLASVARLRLAGAVMGVVVGCTLGATALLFGGSSALDNVAEGDDSEEKLRRLLCVVQDMITSSDVLRGTSCNVYMSGISNSNDNISTAAGVALPVESSSMAKRCKEQAETVMEDNNTLYIPVGGDDDVVAVLKLTKDSSFSNEDIEGAEQMARHIGIFMDRMLLN